MALGYPWGTYTPIGTYDRSDQEQAAFDELLADIASLPTEAYYAAIAERMGIVIDASDEEEEEPEKKKEEEVDPWLQFLIDQESPNVE